MASSPRLAHQAARGGRGTHDAIDAWWARGFLGAFQGSRRGKSRVGAAFRRVLGRLSPAECQAFLRARPTVICEPEIRGAMFYYRRGRPLTIVYLGSRVLSLSDRSLRTLVAHEVSHVVLGHQTRPGGSRCERAADALVSRWGFGRSYSRAMIPDLLT